MFLQASRQGLPVYTGLAAPLAHAVVDQAGLGLDEGGEGAVVGADLGQLVEHDSFLLGEEVQGAVDGEGALGIAQEDGAGFAQQRKQ